MGKTPQNIYYSAQFLFKIWKILGLASYNFDITSLSLKTNLCNYFEFALSIMFYIGATILQWKNYKENTFRTGVQSKLLDQLWQYQYLLQHFFAIFIVAYNFMKRKFIQELFQLVSNFDVKMERLNWRYKVSHSRNLSFCFILATFASITLYEVSRIYVNGAVVDMFIILRYISYVVIYEFFLLLSMQFILSTYCIYTRLKSLCLNIKFVSRTFIKAVLNFNTSILAFFYH